MMTDNKPAVDQPGPPKKPSRRWLQFSLRSLLIFTVICALACEWIVHWIEHKRMRQEAIDALLKIGGRVIFDFQQPGGSGVSTGPMWLRRQLGENAFDDVVEVDLIGDELTDEALKNLKAIPSVKSLRLLYAGKVTDSGLSNLAPLVKLQRLVIEGSQVTGIDSLDGLPELESLTLAGNNLTDAGIAKIKGLTGLRELSLSGRGLTDAGLIHIKGLSKLKVLNLCGDSITDAGLNHLRGLVGLQRLNLARTRVIGKGLASLFGLNQLNDLNLAETDVNDHAAEQLCKLTRLQTLNLRGTRLTDAGLKRVAEMSNLRSLILTAKGKPDSALERISQINKVPMPLRLNPISDQGFTKLQKALPNCVISR